MNDDENRPESLDDRAARVLGALGDNEEGERAEDADEAAISGDAAADGKKQSAKPPSDERNAQQAIAPPQHARQCGRIQHIALDQFESRSQTFKASAEIVENNNFMPGAFQRPSRMTADISGTTNHQNDHVISFPLLVSNDLLRLVVSRRFSVGVHTTSIQV